MISINTTSDYIPAFWQRNKAVCRGKQTAIGSRIQRIELQRLKFTYSLREIKEMYPWLPDENIEQA